MTGGSLQYLLEAVFTLSRLTEDLYRRYSFKICLFSITATGRINCIT